LVNSGKEEKKEFGILGFPVDGGRNGTRKNFWFLMVGSSRRKK